jgi:DNA-binding XRE family transcriptional regulator
MNQVERLRDDLRRRFPALAMEISPPADRDRGIWDLEIRRGTDLRPIIVEWRSDRGFGVSTPEESDYGVGVDEVYPNAKAAFDRISRLVLSGGNTEPPLAVRLAELRQACGLTQGELAARAGVGQANISRIEGRGDVLVSTLAKVVAAMGGKLSIRASFPDGVERELRFESTTIEDLAPGSELSTPIG